MRPTKLIVNAVVLATVMVGGMWLGCNSNDNGTQPTTPTALQPITNLGAYSASATSVGLAWTATPDAGKTDFAGYQIVAKRVSGTDSVVTSAGTNAVGVVVAGLTNGTIYDFEVTAKAAAGSATLSNSSAVTVRWAPASRYENESGSPPPIQVYETSSDIGFASGLIFFSPSAAGPKTVSLLSADSSAIDVYVKTETNNAVSLNSSNGYRPGRRITRFNLVTRDDSTLNNPQALPVDTTNYSNSGFLFDSVQVSIGKILYFKSNDGNYGRILVERNPATGRLIWGSSPEQYLSLRISYQSVAFNPYAKPIKLGVRQGRRSQ